MVQGSSAAAKADDKISTSVEARSVSRKHAGGEGTGDDYVDQYSSSFVSSIERNQIHISRLLLTCLYVVHVLFPPAKPYTDKFIHLQYQIQLPESTAASPLYDIGIDDVYYVAFWIVMLTFLRSALMLYCFMPLAVHGCKIHSKKKVTRFAEQGWSNFYYTCSFGLGFYLYFYSPYWLSEIDHIYIGWPHDQLSPLFKKYYLITIAFWIQQMVVLNIEERRKDHWQMFSHHVITFCLVVGLYYYYFGRVAHLIVMIMDSVDILLITAKMLKYLGFLTACDVFFVLFVISWIVLRHGLYNILTYHAYLNAGPAMGEMECRAGLELKRCWTPGIINVFIGLLIGLQVLTIIWMYFIFKVAYKVMMGKGADDVRSDEEDTDEEEEEDDEDDVNDEDDDEDDETKGDTIDDIPPS